MAIATSRVGRQPDRTTLLSPYSSIIKRIRAVMAARRMTIEALVAEYNGRRLDFQKRHPKHRFDRMHRTSFSRFLNDRFKRQHIAKLIAVGEILADAELSEMLDAHALDDPRTFDPSRGDGGRFHEAWIEAEKGAKVLRGWAEFLPCSFVPDEFMRLHHRALLGVFRPDDEGDVTALIQAFDEIGTINRQRFTRDRKSRPERFVQIMFDSDFEKIQNGTDVYRGIPVQVRRDCLKHLQELLDDQRMGVELKIVKARKRQIRLCHHGPDNAAIRFDTVAVIDNHFAFRRNYHGDLEYGQGKDFVEMNAGVVGEL